MLDGLARALYGRTRHEAHVACRCVRCWEIVSHLTLAPDDAREYRISALCPKCWPLVTAIVDELFPDEEGDA